MSLRDDLYWGVVMSDLIQRQDVNDLIKQICDACGEGEKYKGVMCRCCRFDDFIGVVDNIPSAETERKKGEWVEKEYVDNVDYKIPEWQSAKCSVCGKYMTAPYQYYFTDFSYCPNCGADMRTSDESAASDQ